MRCFDSVFSDLWDVIYPVTGNTLIDPRLQAGIVMDKRSDLCQVINADAVVLLAHSFLAFFQTLS